MDISIFKLTACASVIKALLAGTLVLILDERREGLDVGAIVRLCRPLGVVILHTVTAKACV